MSALQVSINSLAAVEGSPINNALVATITGGNPATPPSATVSWGDGTTSTGTVVASPAAGQYQVSASKPAGYAEEGSPTLSVTVSQGGTTSSSTWTTLAPLATPRGYLATAIGPDGRIYAIGGESPSSGPTSEVDVFDPVANAWTTVASLPGARSRMAAAYGPDGRIYTIGGRDAYGNTTAEVDVYDPVANTWATVAPLPSPRESLAAASGPDGRIYAIGGGTAATGNPPSTEVDVYDPSTNTWSVVASLPAPRSFLAASVGPGGTIEALGGRDASGNPSAEVDVYSPSSNTWTVGTSLPSARRGLAAARGLDGRVYAVGGTGTSGVTSEVDALGSGGWSVVAPLPSGRSQLAAVLGLDGRIYALGGRDVNGNPSGEVDAYATSSAGSGSANVTAALAISVADAPLSVKALPIAAGVGQPLLNVRVATFTDADPGAAVSDFAATVAWGDGTVTAGTVAADPAVAGQFDVTAGKPAGYAAQGQAALTVTVTDGKGASATAAWSPVAALPSARSRVAVATGLDGLIYAVGGVDATNTPSAEADVYSPATDTWTVLASQPDPRQQATAATGPDGQVYVVGGLDVNGNPVAEVDAYNPATNLWTTVAPLPSARSGVGTVAGPDGKLYAVGGRLADGTPSAEVDSYDPTTGSWTTVAGLPSARSAVAVAEGPRGLIYAIGGSGATGPSSEVDVYNPANGNWSVGPALPDARTTAAATGGDGRIYAIGGFANPNGYTTEVDALSPSGGAWVQVAPLATARGRIGAVAGADGRIYAIGGLDASGNTLAEVDAYTAIGRAIAGSTAAVMVSGDSLTVAVHPPAAIVKQPLTNVTVATFTDSNPAARAPGFSTTVAWGDGTVTAGTVAADPAVAGQFDVTASKPAGYATPGRAALTVTVNAGNGGTSRSWATVAPLTSARDRMAVVTGGDGRIYAIGGVDSTNTPSAEVDAFDPVAGTWTTVAPLPDPRGRPAGVAGPDGRIYVLGGQDASNNPVAEVDLYNPATGTWTIAAPLPTARSGIGAAAGQDGRIYAIGGTGAGNVPSSEVDTFDPATGTWTTVAALPEARSGVGAATGPFGGIFAIGGYATSGPAAEVDVYNPTSGLWTTVAGLPTARSRVATATGADGRIYAIGGYTTANSPTSEVDSYNPATDAWTAVAPLPLARDGAGAATGPDGRIYVAGGNTPNPITEADALLAADRSSATASAPVAIAGDTITVSMVPVAVPEGKAPKQAQVATFTDSNPGVSASGFSATVSWGDGTTSTGTVVALASPPNSFGVQASKPTGYAEEGSPTLTVSVAEAGSVPANTWVSASPLPTPRTHLATVTGGDGRIYAIGGVDSSGAPSSEVDTYNPSSGAWSVVASLLDARSALGATVGPDGRIYAIGGLDAGSNPSAEVDVYDPAANSWTLAAPLTTPRAGIAAAAGQDGRIYAIGGDGPGNVPTAEVDAFSPSTGSWTTVTSLPDARAYLAATTGPRGAIFAIGGLDANQALSTEVDTFNPTAGTWSGAPPLPNGRSGLAAAVGPDGRIYALGGRDSSGGPSAEVDVFDPMANSWAAGVPLSTARNGIAAATGPDGRIYAVGGGPVATAEVDALAPVAPASSGATGPIVVSDPTVTAKGNTLTVAAGYSFSGLTVASFTDPGGPEATGDYSATIAWGDGQTSAGTITYDLGTRLFAVRGGHTYATAGTETLTVTIGHDAASPATVTGVANVQRTSVATSTALASSSNPTTYGQALTLTATVSPALTGAPSPTGTVTFLDGTTNLGSAPLVSGIATLSTSALTAGGHSLTAVYGGDAYDQTSTSVALSETVAQAAPTVSLASSTPAPVFGQPVTFTASVGSPGAGTPSGTVTFLDGTTTLGTATLVDGAAALSVSALAVGSHAIAASYGGDADFQGGSATLTQGVGQDATTVALSPSTTSPVFGQAVTLSARVAVVAPGVGTPTGTVTFSDGSTILGSVPLANGVATLATSGLALGGHSISAAYSGDADDGGGVSSSASVSVVQSGTTTSLASSGSPSRFGQAVTLSATVAASAPGAGTPTGTVTFLDGSTTLGTATLANGIASLTVAGLSAGTHSITASYPGDVDFLGGTSAALSQAVSASVTATTLVTSASSSVFGQEVTLTATVAAPGNGVATGSVTFLDGGSAIGTVPLSSSGVAILTTSTLAMGGHSLTASYSGDANDQASSSTTQALSVSPDTTATTLSASASPTLLGQAVTFTATVAVAAPGLGTPTGSVTFLDGSTALGTVALSGGVATLTTSALAVGGHSIQASYAGDGNDQGSMSAALSQSVQPGATSTTLTSSATPSTYGQAVTLSATVSGVVTPTGTVTFQDGTTTLGTATLANGSATLEAWGLSAGNHSITATYSGDANDQGSSSAPLSQVVQPAATASAVVSSAAPSVFGQAVTLSATVSGAVTPTGSVTFLDGSKPLGTVSLAGGSASLSTSALAVGSHAITVAYSGDANFAASTSASFAQAVNPDATLATVSTNGATQSYGQPITLTAAVSVYAPGSGTPTGSVTFLDGSTALGTVALSGNFASLTTSALAAGSHAITAVYSGDADDQASTSAALAQAINPAATSVGLGTSAAPAYHGQAVTLTARVAGPPAGFPLSGTVTFLDGSTSLGTVSVGDATGGVARLTTSALATGTHAITAVYSGDANDQSSASAALSQAVSPNLTNVSYSTSATPTAYGQAVTFTARVSLYTPGSGTPTGSVTFYDGATALGTGSLSNGVATFTTSSLSVGPHAISFAYSGDGDDQASSSSGLSQGVTADVTSVLLSSSSATTAYGQGLTLTANVGVVAPGSGTPTGTVTFKDGTTTLGTAALANGSATLSVPALGVGSHSITAWYSGDANDQSGASSALPETVNPDATSVSVSPSAASTAYGQAVTLTAAVAASAPGSGTPTGTVTFEDGAATLGTGTLANGVATLTTSALGVGGHSIAAVYGGDANDQGSTSTAASLTVQKDSTATVLTTSASPASYGQAVTFRAAVTASPAGAATGTVTFLDGTTSLGTVTLTSGVATFATSGLGVGSHSITAVYGGDANDQGSTSPTLGQAVQQDATVTALASSASSTTFGQAVTLTASVAAAAPGAGTPTGTVTFKDGTTTLGTGTLFNGVATLTTSALAAGSHSLSASYAGDANFVAGTSPALTQAVSQAATSASVASSASPSTYGQAVTFTATIVPVAPGAGTPTGTVTFKDGTTTLGTATLSGGVATFTTSTLAAGNHSVTAVFAGSSNFQASTSQPLNQAVQQATTTTVTSSADPALPGQSVTLKATVAISAPGSGTATGTVTFKDGSTVLGTATLSNGVATFVTSSLAQGAHSITAVYGGNSLDQASTSAAFTQSIKAATKVSLSSSQPTSSFGSAVTFTAVISDLAPGTAVPTGIVTFMDGSTVIGTATVVNGVARFTTSSLLKGKHSITAVYGGDAGDQGSTSSVLTQAVR